MITSDDWAIHVIKNSGLYKVSEIHAAIEQILGSSVVSLIKGEDYSSTDLQTDLKHLANYWKKEI